MIGNMRPTDPALLALIEKTKGRVMTKAELDAQRMSWVVGGLMLSNLDMSRDKAIAAYNRAVGT